MRGGRSTPAGSHRPVMLETVLEVLAPRAGQIAVDATVGFGGHAVELLQRVGPAGKLIGLDRDADNLEQARARLEAVGHPFALHHTNFAGLANVLGAESLAGVDLLLADLGMSSMQVDDPERGFSYRRDGPHDMRMDRSRGQTAADLLASIDEAELARALAELGDELNARPIAAAIVKARGKRPLARTSDLVDVIAQALKIDTGQWKLHPRPGKWNLHPAARTFQALRLLVNRELESLEHLLRILPDCLQPGGCAALISFHSGEDRLVKGAFRDGLRLGVYAEISKEPVRPGAAERVANPRARSAKLRWARKADA
ncbi:MAG: 16S rRNA (cytosine(1402)-N(4))-methyltransferase RsmH [Gemmataceae bacterium]